MAETKKMSEPGNAWEEVLNAVLEDKPEVIKVRGKGIGLGDLRKGTLRFLTDKQLSAKDDGDPKNTAKYAAALVINNWWGLRAFFGLWWRIKWRWYFYVKQYTDKELLPLILASKKKADLATAAYMMNTTLVTGMRDTSMTKTREEARRIQAENTLEQLGQQPKSSPTSQQADTSSEDS